MVSDSIDTNLMMSCLSSGRSEQREKTIRLLSTPNTAHHISVLAISECLYVMEKNLKFSRQLAIDKINFFLTHYSDVVKYNRDLTSHVFPFYLDHPKLSFNDCCLAYYASANNAEPLYTFDAKLAKQHPSAKLLS